ncbi:MAG: hypothetical protein E7286_03625 [Lachnospiraceae bacterium]|nr:hypothetical protein [Lachnospiraceae bacterium]
MKKSYKLFFIVLAAILVVVGAILILKGEKKREIVLTDFKYGQEYQFEELIWGVSLEEVEDYLNCSLEPDSARMPAPEGYAFYNLTDITYILDENETKAIIEFYEDGLSMIQFNIRPENPNEFFDDIVAVWQESFGPETQFLENKETGGVGYKWKTDKSMLTINHYNSSIIISVGTLEILNK